MSNDFERSMQRLYEIASPIGEYEVMRNEDGMFLIKLTKTYTGDRTSAVFITDGGAHAFLMKGAEVGLICNDLHPEASKLLAEEELIYVAEPDSMGDYTSAYPAQVMYREGTTQLMQRLLK